MMRILALAVLVLLSGCQRYTIGAANSAPRVVSGGESVEYGTVWDTAQADELAPEAAHNETVVAEHEESVSEDHTASDAHATESDHTADHDTGDHSTTIPEVDSAMTVIRESFAHVRGSRAARHEAAQALETSREALHAVAETGAISHWEDLDHYFETAIEKVSEGTNDAPNTLNHLLEKLEKAGKH
jgi:hypothetical protein